MPNLIGIGNSQIPTNGMLGGLAYQSPDNVVIKNLELTNLLGHNSVLISSSVVDVFVYDTRKDSDGGQWRKRTQHTSWYNETLNTATRGSRRDFPQVALIVVDANRLIIYDADDPDLPMWMMASTSSTSVFISDGYAHYANCVSALNGIIAVGLNQTQYEPGSYGGMVTLNFPADSSFKYGGPSTPYSGRGTYGNTVRGCFQVTWYQLFFAPSNFSIINGIVNDIAMTVLPNAPIDSATGLPVPTIAIGSGYSSNGGVTIIRDDGTVVSTTLVNCYAVRWIDNTRIYAGSVHVSGVVGFRHYILNYPSLAFERLEGFSYEDTGLNWSSGSVSGTGDGILGNRFTTIKDGFSIGYGTLDSYNGLNLINYDPNPNAGLFAYIKTNYNTGWMCGDIKGAWLSDTSTGSVTGTELVTNGTFTSNVNGWTAYTANGGSIAWQTGGYLRISNSDTTDPPVYAYQSITTVIGQRYLLSVEKVAGTNFTAFISSSLTANPTPISSAVSYIADTGVKIFDFIATATTSYIILRVNTNAVATVDVDNVSVRIAEADRSVNNKGLAVYGTITKSAVATGSNLVAYSGFSASNYLLQPYNSSLSFGTGNFSIMGWVNTSNAANSGYRIFLSIMNPGGSQTDDSSIVIKHASSAGGGNLYAFLGGTDGTIGIDDNTSGLTNIWTYFCLLRSGNSLQLWINNKLNDSKTVALTSKGSTSHILTIGFGWSSGSVFEIASDTSVSLIRISTTAPSPEQIKKIYNDEKVLFQENTQCTLYGASNAVTALAYDDTYQILSAGTSSGRSDFRGFQRINNTTTAVTTAISASNGLIAEQ